jgi:hypothetical protein
MLSSLGDIRREDLPESGSAVLTFSNWLGLPGTREVFNSLRPLLEQEIGGQNIYYLSEAIKGQEWHARDFAKRLIPGIEIERITGQEDGYRSIRTWSIRASVSFGNGSAQSLTTNFEGTLPHAIIDAALRAFAELRRQ